VDYITYKIPIKAIVIDDYFNDDSDPKYTGFEKIKFGISKTNLVQYKQESEFGPYLHNSTLVFNKTVSEILIPKNTGIQILYSERDIEGIIASPVAIIDHVGNLELTVENPESKLRLCMESKGIVRLNRRVKFYGAERDNKEGYTKGEKFSKYKEEYTKYLSETTLDPEIIEDEKGKIANYEYARFGHYEIHACMHYGLVVITKSRGKSNIMFENLENSREHRPRTRKSSYQNIDKIDEISKLRIKLKEAIAKEEFEKAAEYRDKINVIGTNIDDVDKSQQSL
jgi:hypothetical protein